MMASTPPVATLAQVEQLQEMRPIGAARPRGVPRRTHRASGRQNRSHVVAQPDRPAGGLALRRRMQRELQALGMNEAAQKTVAMVVLIDTAVHTGRPSWA